MSRNEKPPKPPPAAGLHERRCLNWGILIAASLSVVGFCSCSRQDEAATGPGPGAAPQRPSPVLVAGVVRKDMPVALRAIGRVTPIQTVTVKPMVTGLVASVPFREGSDVQAGDPLFAIDRRPFEVALDEAKAALAQAKTQAENAKAQERRYRTLVKGGAVPQKEQEEAAVAAKTAADQILIAEAAVQKAELNLSYCDVRAPISGRTGRVLTDAGNIVSAYQTEMVVINQIQPIEVTFAVPEQQLPALQRGMSKGALKVTAETDASSPSAVFGHVTFLDNAVKPGTGTIDVRATFANDPPTLWPGQFAHLSVEVSVDTDAVVAPARAIQPGQTEPFVFVVQPDSTVAIVNVVVARTVENEAVIAEGLKGGEKVVIDGHDRLRAGAKVDIKANLEDAAVKVTAVTRP